MNTRVLYYGKNARRIVKRIGEDLEIRVTRSFSSFERALATMKYSCFFVELSAKKFHEAIQTIREVIPSSYVVIVHTSGLHPVNDQFLLSDDVLFFRCGDAQIEEVLNKIKYPGLKVVAEEAR
jgi:hypothetical protein